MAESEERVEVESNGSLAMDYKKSENPTLADIENSSTTTTDQNQNQKVEEREIEKEKEKTTTNSTKTLYSVFHSFLTQIFYPENNNDDDDGKATATLLHRIKSSVYQNAPYLREASKNSTKNLLIWTRQGSPIRALLVISVGTITLLALTGLLVFMLFFLAATTNAVIISFFMSLAAAGGFLAIFFACIASIYVGALLVAVVVISTATFTTVVTVLITTGWLAFFYVLWWVTKKCIGFAECALNMTSSRLSAYTAGRQAHYQAPGKASTTD